MSVSVFIEGRGRVVFEDVRALMEHRLEQARSWKQHYDTFTNSEKRDGFKRGYAEAAASWGARIVELESWLRVRRAEAERNA